MQLKPRPVVNQTTGGDLPKILTSPKKFFHLKNNERPCPENKGQH
jgi:hypothetical protein